MSVDGATGRDADAVRQALRMGDSGTLYIYDRAGRWVSTFHAGQLDREDVLADLEAAADGDLGS